MKFPKLNEKLDGSFVDCIDTKASTCLRLLICNYDFVSVTSFGLPNGERIRFTKKLFGKSNKFDGEIIVNIGKPNYKERIFLQQCKKDGSTPDTCVVTKRRHYIGKRGAV